MRHLVGLSLALALASGPLGTARQLGAQEPAESKVAAEAWTPEELENLLAPIALYPDPILAQVLVAATYPEEIAAAASYVRRNGTSGLDDQSWNISVRAIAHYAPVLNLMAEGEDWTIALGQAYVEQPKDVMAAVQQLRHMAQAQGNLASTNEQQVVEEREVIRIEPAQPRVIYVPTYDPAVVYFRPVYVSRAHPAYWSWGIGYPIGAWLTYDFDWWGPGVYYHGWYAGGPRWVVVSRPWVVISPIYVSTRHTTVIVNRRIVHRSFDPRPLRRYTVVHRTTTFDRHGRPGRRVGQNDRTERGHDRLNDRNDNAGSRPRANPGRGDERREWNRGQGNAHREMNPGQGTARRMAPVPVGGRGVASGNRVRPIATGSDKTREPRGNGSWNARGPQPASPDRTSSRNLTPTRASVPRADRRTATPPAAPSRSNTGGTLSGATSGRTTPPATERGSSGSIPDAVRRTGSARPSTSTLSRPRAQSGAPRAERSAPRAERSAPRAQPSAPRAERSAPRASSGGSGRSSSPSRGAGSSRSGGSGRSGAPEGRGGRGN